MNYRSNMRSQGYRAPSQVRSCNPTQYARTESGCGSVKVPDGVITLATVYTVSQCWGNITDGCLGLDRGTIFDELDKPFKGYTCKKGGCGK